MAMPKQIVELLQQNPDMSSNAIAETLNAKISSVKVTLHKMVKQGRLARQKVARPVRGAKAGPQNVYAYKINTEPNVAAESNPQ